jgi:Ser/Thr protein kinase RdoA (MazF antagonist)
MSDKNLPYASLTPDTVLFSIETTGLRCDGRLLQLNSYENRVFQIGLEDGARVVAKFYRPQRWNDKAILEEHAFSQELSDAEIPAIAPLVLRGQTLHAYEDFRFSISPYTPGRAPELDARETLEWMGRFLGRIHAVGARAPFRERLTLTPQTWGDAALETIQAGDWLPASLAPAYQAVTEQAMHAVRAAFERAGDVRTIRTHGDCHIGNVLWNNGPFFVDFDDCCMAPAIQDLWMLLSGSAREQQVQLLDVLAGYEDFIEFDRRELHLIEPLRTLRMLHMSAWIAKRWHDPAFPVAFPWFGSERYWQDRILELREQIALMSEPPLTV